MTDPATGSQSVPVPVDLSGSLMASASRPVRNMGKLRVANREMARSIAESGGDASGMGDYSADKMRVGKTKKFPYESKAMSSR